MYHQPSSFVIIKLNLSLFIIIQHQSSLLIINHQYWSLFSTFNYHASIFIEPEKMKGNSVTSFQNTSFLLHLNFLFTNKKKSPPRFQHGRAPAKRRVLLEVQSHSNWSLPKALSFRGIGMGHEISHINSGRNLCWWTWIKISLFLVVMNYIGILESQPKKSVMASWFSTKYSFCNCGALLFSNVFVLVGNGGKTSRSFGTQSILTWVFVSPMFLLILLGGWFECIKQKGGLHLSSPFS